MTPLPAEVLAKIEEIAGGPNWRKREYAYLKEEGARKMATFDREFWERYWTATVCRAHGEDVCVVSRAEFHRQRGKEGK